MIVEATNGHAFEEDAQNIFKFLSNGAKFVKGADFISAIDNYRKLKPKSTTKPSADLAKPKNPTLEPVQSKKPTLDPVQPKKPDS